MKTNKLIITGIISAIAIVSITIGTLEYQSAYNENCKSDGGYLVGFLRCTYINTDFSDPIVSKYDIKPNELITRKVNVYAQPAAEIIPQRNCHKFSATEFDALPEDVKYVIHEATEDNLVHPRDNDGDGFYDGFSDPINSGDALDIIRKYDFKLTTEKFEGSLPKQQDTKYFFECIFEDDNKQYRLGFEFDTHFHGYGRHVYVNFTNNDQGFPTIQNDHITLYTGGFNQTVVFTNNLEHDVTINMMNPPQTDNYPKQPPAEVTIPSGKMWSHFFRLSNFGDEPLYQYHVEPDGLSGTILVKGYPHCMTESEVKSLYSQVEAYPNFPTYVPEGYSFECGMHNMNGFVHLGYWTDVLQEKFNDIPNDTTSREFFANGGLTIDYYNEYVINSWTANPDYNKYDKQDEKAEHPWATKLSVLGEPAVFRVQHFTQNAQQYSYNELLIFLDGEIQYKLRSSLPQYELVNITESIISETR